MARAERMYFFRSYFLLVVSVLTLINDTSACFQMKHITTINWLWFMHFTQRCEDARIGGGVQLVGHLNLLTFGIEQHDFLLRELLIKVHLF